MATFQATLVGFINKAATLSGVEHTLSAVEADYLELTRTNGAFTDKVLVPLSHVTAVQIHDAAGTPRLTIQTVTLRNP